MGIGACATAAAARCRTNAEPAFRIDSARRHTEEEAHGGPSVPAGPRRSKCHTWLPFSNARQQAQGLVAVLAGGVLASVPTNLPVDGSRSHHGTDRPTGPFPSSYPRPAIPPRPEPPTTSARTPFSVRLPNLPRAEPEPEEAGRAAHQAPPATLLTTVNRRLDCADDQIATPRPAPRAGDPVRGSAWMAGRTVERSCAGRLFCPHGERAGCIVPLWSKPRVAANHTRQIRSKVDSCPHGDHSGQGDEKQDTP